MFYACVNSLSLSDEHWSLVPSAAPLSVVSLLILLLYITADNFVTSSAFKVRPVNVFWSASSVTLLSAFQAAYVTATSLTVAYSRLPFLRTKRIDKVTGDFQTNNRTIP